MYTPVLGQSPLIDELFHRLREKVKQEILFQKELAKIVGALEMVFAKSGGGGSAGAARAGVNGGLGPAEVMMR